MKLLIVLLLVSARVALIHSFEGRITNGHEAAPNQFPYQVQLDIISLKGEAFCGGTLISSQWILTAAHCTESASLIIISLGSVHLCGSGGVIRLSFIYFIHHDYAVTENGVPVNDISLVYLINPVETSDSIQPINLPVSSPTPPTYEGSMAVASGWGLVATDDSSQPSKLQYINVRVISNEECDQGLGNLNIIKDSMICIDTSPKNTSTCFGDSGGPLVLNNVLIGITSCVSAMGCELGLPAIFTRVTSYLDWIHYISGISA